MRRPARSLVPRLASLLVLVVAVSLVGWAGTASAFSSEYKYDDAAALFNAATASPAGVAVGASGAELASTVVWRTTVAVGRFSLATDGGIGPTVGDLRAAGQADAHHIIQDAAVRDVPGYSRTGAPGIQLEGPSTDVESAHYAATQAQRTAGIGGTYGAERQVACMALFAAGCSPAEVSGALSRADAYFIDQLGLDFDSPLRIPGNRAIP
jgi:hypothetical protein